MAEEEHSKGSVKEVNLEELMEVITSYKCRFCDFTSTSMSEMTEHLQKTHIAATDAPSKQQPSESEVVQPDPVSEAAILPEPKSDSAVLPEPESVLSTPTEGTENIDTETGCLPSSSYDAPVFFSNLGLTSNQGSSSPRSLVSPALLDPKVLTSQMRSVAKNMPIIPSSQPDLQVFTLNNNSAGKRSLPITRFQLVSGSGLALVSTTSLDSVSVPFVDQQKDLGTGPASIAPIVKELFLCGVCGMGFTAVDECNSHMEREHQVQVEGIGSVSDTVVDKLEQRVSIGTQATGKRPGRKRKSEMPPPSSTPPPRKVKDWTGHSTADEENDEDWIPGRSFLSGTRDGKQRRKIRAPKALKEDYVTEKKRTYRKRQLDVKESFHLECNYMGCPTKFRSQASLDIHHSCHNQEDDAFTCIHCHQSFQFWKPLRIHLYRNHKIDCDMFQCDQCQYKTDTLHKLGVHREIHSDHRPYTCDVCGKGFKQLSQMKNHQIIHVEHQRSGRERWFSNKMCEVCKRTFANSKCLKKHVEAVHGQSKPFKCQYCNHTTAWKAMLILHERTHTGEKPFKCDVCSYSTGDHNSLRRHKMRHTGQRQYKCQLCSYTCIQTISLKTHMRNKHPNAEGQVYTCQKCKFRTINRQIYDNHLEDHRNGLVPQAKVETSSTAQQTPLTMTVDGVGNGVTIIPEEPVLFQLQVKKMETGELHANKEDIDKLNAIPQLVNSGMDANQLIYSALNIGSHIDGLSYTAQLTNGIQSTVLPSLQPTKGVTSSYLITFQAPQVLTTHTPSSQPVIVDFRSLSDEVEPVVEAASISSEPSSQDAEPEDDTDMALCEASRGSTMEPEEQVLYTQVPQMVDATSKTSEEMFQAPDFEELEVAGKGSSHVDVETSVPDSFSAPGAEVVSQAGMDGVLQNIIVMDGNQVDMEENQVVHAITPEGGTDIEGSEVVERMMEGEEVDQVMRKESLGEQTESRQAVEGIVDQALQKVMVVATDSGQENPNTSV